jgi:hypothetical protein
VPHVHYDKLSAERFKGTRLLTNTDMGPAELRRHCQLDGTGQRLM